MLGHRHFGGEIDILNGVQKFGRLRSSGVGRLAAGDETHAASAFV